MFAAMSPRLPTFTFGRDRDRDVPAPARAAALSSPYRPAISSPLSSPIRAPAPAGFATSPLAPRDPNMMPHYRTTQSSPIAAPPDKLEQQQQQQGHHQPAFRFATRPARPNPVVQRRDDAREGRRRLFLQNVRLRADDRRWENRGGENEVCLASAPRMSPALPCASQPELTVSSETPRSSGSSGSG